MGSTAAEVEYRHPNLTIVAKDEALDSVLKAVSKEMRIFVTTPAGLNPLVSSDIQNQPIKVAFKKLLGGMSYSMEWKDNGETLVGLTILAETDDIAENTSLGATSNAPSVDQANVVPSANSMNSPPDSPVGQRNDAAQMPLAGTDQEGMEAQSEARRAERESFLAEKRAELDADMVSRREEQLRIRDARMSEDAARSEAEMAEYLSSLGADPVN
jgi:hypothetical protein